MTTRTLNDLGWSDFFARQLDDTVAGAPARLSAVHRSRLTALTPEGEIRLAPDEISGGYAVGDWVMHDGTTAVRVLDRKTRIQRRAAGEAVRHQLVAANLETLAIVTSCNDDFNPARLERYLAIALSGGVLPLVILTKADLVEDDKPFRMAAERISPLVTAISLNAKDPEDTARLESWCKAGQTMALVGSSGVGKTTILNALTGQNDATQSVREADAKGRHTTTSRHLRPTLAGGWLIDTPGMRELGMADASDGIDALFKDVVDLIGTCKFNDCAHITEPGCSIREAIDSGRLEEARYERWQKLQQEDRRNAESVAQARSRGKQMNKVYDGGRQRGALKRRTT